MSGFVDIQVNGYAGVDFNSPTPLSDEQAAHAAAMLKQDGNTEVLATVITAPIPEMVARISRLAELIDTVPEFGEVVAGIHIEGPFISPKDGFVGAHPADAVIAASQAEAERLIAAAGGKARLVTLAPECDQGNLVTRWLANQGIVVAAGHCDPTLDQLDRAIDAGVSLFTHLGNGCSSTVHRHDNIVQRVLSRSDRLMISFIADGHHVPTFALQNYLRCIPEQNVIIVTDAISAAGLGPGEYRIGEQVVHVDEAGAAWAACRTRYAGCATPMPRMVEILKGMGASEDQVRAWTRENPKRLVQQSR